MSFPDWLSGEMSVTDLEELVSGEKPVCVGAFGRCYRSKDERVAVAVVSDPRLSGEAKLLREIRHQNVLAVLSSSEVNQAEKKLCIVYPLKEEDQTLAQHLINDEWAEKLTWPTRLGISLGIVSGLRYLNETLVPPAPHTDLTSSGIVLQVPNRTPKLLWGGVSRLFDKAAAAPVGTAARSDLPAFDAGLDKAMCLDLYALGVVYGEIISGTIASEADALGSAFAGIADMRLQEEEEDEKIVETLTQLSEKCQTASPPGFGEIVDQLRARCDAAGVSVPEEEPEDIRLPQPPRPPQQPQPAQLPAEGSKEAQTGQQEEVSSLWSPAEGVSSGEFPVFPTMRIEIEERVDTLNPLPLSACRLGQLFRDQKDSKCLLARVSIQQTHQLRDINILQSLSTHASVASALARSDPARDRDFFWVAYNLSDVSTMAHVLSTPSAVQAFGWSARLEAARDIAEGLKYLHTFTPKVLHRDLSSKTILLTPSHKATIAWAGIGHVTSYVPTSAGSHTCPTFAGLMDPSRYEERCDIYSFGIIMSELLTGTVLSSPWLPFDNEIPDSRLEGNTKVVAALLFVGKQCACTKLEDRVDNIADAVAYLSMENPPQVKSLKGFSQPQQQLLKLGSNAGAGGPASDESNTEFDTAIEEEANNYFAKIYGGKMQLSALIEKLKQYKKSPKDSNEHKVYTCMIHNLFDEFRFLSRYPARELRITAELFGGIVANKALEDAKLLEALKFVITNLVANSNENLMNFSKWALEKYMHRLPEWQQYCGLLRTKVKDITTLVPGIDQYLNKPTPKQEVEKPKQVPPQERGITSTHIFDISTLMNADNHPVPDPQIEDRLVIIVNNLDSSNVEARAKEIVQLLNPVHFPWFASYLVIKRCSLEPNFHRLYLTMLSKMSLKALESDVLQATITAIKSLLQSSRILTESSEMSLLKNLGGWLGLLTIGRNKPLMAKKLDLKGLLFNAVTENMLSAVVPLVAKVLDKAADSQVFGPPNPWLMSILYILGDIYELKGIKLALTFEVEVLCKALKLEVQEIKDPNPEQRQRILETYEYAQGRAPRPAFLDKQPAQAPAQAPQPPKPQPPTPPQPPKPAAPAAPTPATVAPAATAAAPTVPAKKEADTWKNTSDDPTWTSTNSSKQNWQDAYPRETFQHHVRVPANTPPELKQAVCEALEKALKELINAVVERSVFIAKTTTKELVVKDFATEPDDEKLRTAAQQMVKCLAAHLAIVTCKDMLRLTMKGNLKNTLSNTSAAEWRVQIPLDDSQLSDSLVKDNLDFGVSLMEKVAIKEAAKVMEVTLAPCLEEREKCRDERGVWKGPDPKVVSEFACNLPEANRPKLGVSAAHLKVYDDFGRMRTSTPEQTPDQLRALEKLTHVLKNIENETEKHYASSPQPEQNILSLTHSNFTTVSQGPHHDAIKKLLCNIPQLIKEDTAVAFAKHIFTRVFQLGDRIVFEQRSKNEQGLYVAMLLNEVCLFILQSVREKNVDKIVEELTKLFLAHDTKWKNKDIAVNFIRLRLIDVQQFDVHLTKALQVQDPPRTVVEFAGSIVQKCLVDEKLTSQKDLKQTLDALQAIANRGAKKIAPQQPQ